MSIYEAFGRAMRVAAPHRLATLIPTAVPTLETRLVEVDIRRQWPSVVGEDAARRSQPMALQGDCLVVIVDNSPWCQEMTLRAPTIVAQLSTRFGTDLVRTLRVTVGSLEYPLAPQAAPSAPHPRQPTPDEIRAIEALVSPITDDDLAATLRRLLVKAGRFASK